MNKFCQDYLEQIKGPFAGINLTRITTDEEFYNKQYVDSIIPFENSDVLKKLYQKHSIHLDIGFGGGFPLLPLASLNKSKKYVGFEARGKKSRVVNEIAKNIGLTNVKTYHQRFEDVYIDRDCIITFKAVSTVENLLPKIITDKNVVVIFYKGPNFYELENIEQFEKDWELVEEMLLDVPGTDGRMIVAFKNRNVLRGTMIRQFNKKTNKNLVSLSQFL